MEGPETSWVSGLDSLSPGQIVSMSVVGNWSAGQAELCQIHPHLENAWSACVVSIPGKGQHKMLASPLVDLIAAFVWDDGEVPVPSAGVQVHALSMPGCLADLPAMARVALLLLLAQAHEARGIRLSDRAEYEHSLELAERCASMLPYADHGSDGQDISATAEAAYLLSAMGRLLSDHFRDEPDADKPGSAFMRAESLAITSAVESVGGQAATVESGCRDGFSGSCLAELLGRRFQLLRHVTDLDEAIAALRRIIQITPSPGISNTRQWRTLVHLLRIRLALGVDASDVDALVDLFDAASSDATLPDALRHRHAFEMVVLLGDHDASNDRPITMRRVEEILTKLLEAAHPGDPMLADYQAALGVAILQSRREALDSKSLERAITLIDRALSAIPDEHPRRATFVRDMAMALRSRGELLHSIADLDHSIQLLKECSSNYLREDKELYSDIQNSLGLALMSRHSYLGDIADIDGALQAFINSAEHDGIRRVFALRNLYLAFASRYARTSQPIDLEAMSTVLRELRKLDREFADSAFSDIEHFRYVTNAARESFDRSGDPEVVARAIESLKTAAASAHPGSGDEFQFLIKQAEMLWRLYNVLGDITQLNEALTILNDVLTRMPPESPYRAETLIKLAMCQRDRHIRHGALSDLELAIACYEEALTLAATDRDDIQEISINLALALWDRYHLAGGLHDLDRAISLVQATISEVPRSIRPSTANTLGIALLDRYQQHRNVTDLQEAVKVIEQAVNDSADTAPIKSALLSNLGNAFTAMYQRTNDLAALTQAIDAYESSVRASRPGDPNRPRFMGTLANGLVARFNRTRQLTDLERAVELDLETLTCAPEGWADRPNCLGMLADHSLTLYLQTGRQVHKKRALNSFRDCCSSGLANRPGVVLEAAQTWSKWALAEGSWSDAASACDAAIQAMASLVEIQYGRRDKEAWIETANGIPARAGYAHAVLGKSRHAVVALEAGRAMQLSETMGYHATDLDELSADGYHDLVAAYRATTARYLALARQVDQRLQPYSSGWSRAREILGACGWLLAWVAPSVVRRLGSVRACGWVGWVADCP